MLTVILKYYFPWLAVLKNVATCENLFTFTDWNPKMVSTGLSHFFWATYFFFGEGGGWRGGGNRHVFACLSSQPDARPRPGPPPLLSNIQRTCQNMKLFSSLQTIDSVYIYIYCSFIDELMILNCPKRGRFYLNDSRNYSTSHNFCCGGGKSASGAHTQTYIATKSIWVVNLEKYTNKKNTTTLASPSRGTHALQLITAETHRKNTSGNHPGKGRQGGQRVRPI